MDKNLWLTFLSHPVRFAGNFKYRARQKSNS